MPVIEYNSSGENFPLKMAPPDGFVKARPLSYDEMLTRRDLAAKFIYRQQQDHGSSPSPNGGGGIGSKKSDPETEMMMESANKVVQQFQFANQIIDHNLELPGGVKFNFANPAHLKRLPPKLGAEIEDILDSLNQEEDAEDFPEQPTTSSPEPTASVKEVVSQA